MDARFYRQARELHPGASERELERVAEQLRKAYYTELQLKSALARRERATAAASKGRGKRG